MGNKERHREVKPFFHIFTDLLGVAVGEFRIELTLTYFSDTLSASPEGFPHPTARPHGIRQVMLAFRSIRMV